MICAIDGIINYPDPDCEDLKNAIAVSDGVSRSAITCGNGGADLLYRIGFGLKPQKVLLPVPAFVEYEEVYHDRFYGTLKSEVERIWGNGHVIVFDVDVKGGVNLKKYFGDAALSVLIVPPSMEVLESRLRGRGTDSEEAILERLAKAASELEFARGKFDFELVNDKLEDTFRIAEETVNAFLCG